MTKLTQKGVVTAIQRMRGNIWAAARAFRVSRTAIQHRIHADLEMQQILTDEREALCDDAETALVAATRDRKPWAICYLLDTIGKDRGWRCNPITPQ
jgi:hypothetical protein